MAFSSIASAIYNTSFSPLSAAMGCLGINAAYDGGNSTRFDVFGTQMSVVDVQTIAGTGMRPDIFVLTTSPRGKIVLIPGSTHWRQIMGYLAGSSLVQPSWTSLGYNGKANVFVYNLYTPIRSSLLALIIGSNQIGMPVAIYGHSLGGALSQLLAFDLTTNAVSLKGSYAFGSPKWCNENLAISVNTRPCYNVRNIGDPVPFYPMANYRLTDTVGGNSIIGETLLDYSNWSNAGKTYEISPTEITERAEFVSSGDETVDQLVRLINWNGVLAPHRSDTYYTNLAAHIPSGGDVTPGDQQISAATTITTTTTIQPENQTQAPGNQLPPLYPSNNLPPPPSGGTSVGSQSYTATTSRRFIFNSNNLVKARRAKNGDGRVKRQVAKFVQLMSELERHDGRAKATKNKKFPKGTVILRDKTKWTADHEAAWRLLYKHFFKLQREI